MIHLVHYIFKGRLPGRQVFGSVLNSKVVVRGASVWHRNQDISNRYKLMRKMYKEYVPWVDRCWRNKVFFQKVAVKPYVYGYRQVLVPIPAISNREEGLKEAVDCATDYIQFSTKDRRYCEIQESRLQDKGSDSHFGSWSDFIISNYFHKDKTYRKGMLGLNRITEREYDSLSPAAKRWFDREVVFSAVRKGMRYERVEYSPFGKISMSMLMEIQLKIYVREHYIPIGEKFRRNAYLENYLYGSGHNANKVIHEFFPHEGMSAGNKWCKYKYNDGRGKAKQQADAQMFAEIRELEMEPAFLE